MRKLFTALAAFTFTAAAFAQSGVSQLRTNPEDGSTVTELTKVELISNDVRYSYSAINSAGAITVKKDGVDFCGVSSDYGYPFESVVLKTPATEPGVYTIDMPADSWELSNDGGDTYTDDVTLTFTVGNGGTTEPEGLVLTTEPAGDSTVGELSVITLTSNKPISLYTYGGVKVTKDGADFCKVDIAEVSSTEFTITLRETATENGVYKLTIPEAAFFELNDNYDDVPKTEFTYTVDSSVLPLRASFTADPAAGDLTTPLTTITLTSDTPDYPAMDITSSSSIKVLYEGDEFCGVRATAQGAKAVLTLQETMTDSGTYTVVIPAGSWTVYDASQEDNYRELEGGAVELVYNVDLGGPRYNLSAPEGRVTPVGVVRDENDDTIWNLDGGSVAEIKVKFDGELYPVAGSTVNVYNKRSGYNVDAAVTADQPKKAVIGNKYTTEFHFALDPALVTNGTYTLTIPKGILGTKDYVDSDKTEGEANKAMTFVLKFNGGEPEPEPQVKYDLKVNRTRFPAEGFADMADFTWSVINILVDAGLRPAEGAIANVSNSDGSYNITNDLRYMMEMGNTATLGMTCEPVPTKNGTYVLTIPAGSFGDAEWIADPDFGHTNPEIKIYYRVVGADNSENAPMPKYEIELGSNPANEGTVDIKDNPFTLTLTAPGELGFYPNTSATLVCKDAEYSGTATIVSAEVVDGNTVFTTQLSEPVLVNGDYTLKVPEGIIGDADYVQNFVTGKGNIAYTATFTVTGGEGQKEPAKYELVPTVTPADGSFILMSEFDKIVFVFPAGTKTTSDDARASMKCPEANYFDTAYYQKDTTDGTFYLAFGTKPKRDGVYTMTMTKESFTNADGSDFNPEITYTWEIKQSGVDSILTDEESEAGVYNLQGVYMGKSLENLPAGMYIVKGRKVMVNK